MKKKALLLTLALTVAMSMTALAGCGTETANEEKAAVEETPVVQDDTVEVADEGETTEAGTDEDSSVVYEDGSHDEEYLISLVEFEDINRTVTTPTEIPVYCEEGYKVGYMKAGSIFTLVGEGLNGSAWNKLENPDKGTEYDYLYITDDYVPADSEYTQDEVLAMIQERFSNKDMGYELLDAPESDMEKAEFSVSKTETIPTSVVDSYLYAELHLSDYTKFYIEENGEDAANYNFVIYYKDLYQAE